MGRRFSIYALAVGIPAVFLFGFCSGRRTCRDVEPSVVRDTVVVVDTVTERMPVCHIERIVDTIAVFVPVRDTIERTDTIYLPRTQRAYKGAEYSAWVSGYEPRLDSIEVFQKTVRITETKTISVPSRKRWSIGVQAGYGAALNGRQVILSPYVGVGISYSLYSW